ncbi:BTAD domain-containing putative transcriptional regulator [Streptomyces sp. NPDC057245]|uniref:BTAD domain-containing putative transcriptional regulator n=1 Tax=Streptomyces TaxID=1883 RepID=UPI001C1E586B|nr:BTAD domain-containing putative transcriptional regulator [Streptomyces sp. A108]MBU6534588.1 AAA family ATPase [Streptomyces sp. A108]
MDPTERCTTRYSLLGPVQAHRGERTLDLGPRQRRVLLTRLLIEDGRPVPVNELCRSLWNDGPPAGAMSSVRAHVSRLRSVLDPARRGRSTVLVAGPVGYALKVPRDARDTTVFEDSLHRVRGALKRGELLFAQRELDAALGLWRGEALGDAAEYPFAIRERERLNAVHQDAKELRAAILLYQGDLERAIEVAEELAQSAPLREASWALLMRALYAAGRSVEALGRYDRFRGMLARELGLDPSPGLSRLHTAILRHDTDVLDDVLPVPASATVTAGGGPAVAPLVGRAEETAQLAALRSGAVSGRTGWALVSGGPGSGKTRLLEEAAGGAPAEGLVVVRATGGRPVGPHRKVVGGNPAAQLLGALRQEGTGTRPDGPVRGAMGGEVMDTLVRALTRTTTPTLCLIDDLDFAPPEFHSLLLRLAEAPPDAPVAYVCAVRDAADPSASGLLSALARRGTTWLPLEPLTVAEVTELLAAHGAAASVEEATRLHRRAAGNPFTLGELLKLPPERRTGPGARVPTAVRSAVHARLAELPDQVRQTLRNAACDGEWLDIGLLAEVRSLPSDLLLPQVDAAVAARLLVWEPDSGERPEGGYRFPELTREVVLSTLTPSARQKVHAVLARKLIDRPGTDPARLARHLRVAGPMAPAAEPKPKQDRSPAGVGVPAPAGARSHPHPGAPGRHPGAGAGSGVLVQTPAAEAVG